MPLYGDTQSQAANYQPGGADCRPEILARLTREEAASEADRCAQSAEQHRLQSNDLTQQTRAADAAQSGAWTAYEATRIALAGLIGGFLTLVAAGFAAYYARRAYLAARRQADLADRALKIETRPFIYLDSVDWKEVFDEEIGVRSFRFTFNIKNLGKLPATNLRLWTSVVLVPRSHRRAHHIFEEKPVIVSACPQGVTRKTFGHALLSPEEAVDFEAMSLGIALGLKMVFDTRFTKDKTVCEYRWADAFGMRELSVIYLDRPQLPGEADEDLFDWGGFDDAEWPEEGEDGPEDDPSQPHLL